MRREASLVAVLKVRRGEEMRRDEEGGLSGCSAEGEEVRRGGEERR